MKICSMISFCHTFCAEMKPSQHFNVALTLIRRWKWNKIRRRIFIIAKCWYNVRARRWNNVETKLHNVETTLVQHFLLYIYNSTANEISKIFLTVADIAIHNGGNNGDIHRSLKHYCIQNFKTSLKNIKI